MTDEEDVGANQWRLEGSEGIRHGWMLSRKGILCDLKEQVEPNN